MWRGLSRRINRRAFATQPVAEPKPAYKQLRYHFLVSMVPMVGFGLVDNSIMLRAGDYIDENLGEKFKLNTLTAAAIGQALSDFSGVIFGGYIGALAANLGLKAASFTPGQLEMKSVRVAGTAGAALGVFIGCIMGMTNLLFMDLGTRERLKRQKELKTIFNTVVDSSKDLLHSEISTIWLMSEDGKELWTHAGTGLGDRVLTLSLEPKNEIGNSKSGLTVTCAKNKEIIKVEDCYLDSRFDPSLDKRHNFRTRSMLCVPVMSSAQEVLGVVQFINKRDKKGENDIFNESDAKLAKMMAHHVAIFIEQSMK